MGKAITHSRRSRTCEALVLLSALLVACSSDEHSGGDATHEGGAGASIGGNGATAGDEAADGGVAGTPVEVGAGAAGLIEAGTDSGPLGADTVGPKGGRLSFEGGDVTFEFPPGAVDQDLTVTVTSSQGDPSRPAAIPGTEFSFGPEGTTFAKPVRVTTRYAKLPTAVDPAMLAIAEGVGAQWLPLHSDSDADAQTVSADLAGFSPYGVVNLGFANIERSCGLTGIGELWCWGSNWSADKTKFLEPTKVSGDVTFAGYDSLADHRKLSSALGSACGVSTSGDLWCFGAGQSAYMSAPPPVQLAPDHHFAEISTWGGTLCGIEAPDASDSGSSGGASGGDANIAYCWGDNTRGNLGIGPVSIGQQNLYRTPMQVVGGLDFLHIAVGPLFTCGITTDGFTYCWGDETYGQLGRGRGDYSGVPIQLFIQQAGQQPMPLTLVSISAGGTHACGIDSAGRGICWGHNDDGQIGDGSPVTGVSPDPNEFKPPTAIEGYSWLRLEAGGAHTCGITSAARTYCWGNVNYLGDGRTVQSGEIGQSTPVEVADQSFFTLAAYLSTCGMTTSGGAYCWGYNAEGDLGIGVADPFPLPYRTSPQKVKVTGLLP